MKSIRRQSVANLVHAERIGERLMNQRRRRMNYRALDATNLAVLITSTDSPQVVRPFFTKQEL